MEHILAINVWNYGDYAGFEGRELFKNDGESSWTWQKHNDNRHGPWQPPTQGIKIYAQCNTTGSDRHMYAMKVTQDELLTMGEIEQGKANLARMTKITAKYEATCKKFGYPRNFAQFAGYVADAIGAELAETAAAWQSDTYTSMSIDQIQYKEEILLNPERA